MAQDLAAHHGYHGRLEINNPSGKDCVRCHLEHNGADFSLIHWDPPKIHFDHNATGYALTGKHSGLPCEQCHLPKNLVNSLRPLIQYKDLTKTYFGLSPDCATCHSDPHKGQLGNDCQSCHNTNDWKAAKQFDHAKTRYPLTGKHAEVACESCHKPDTAGGPARFRDMKFGACSDCHSDPHQGAFAPQRCEACHTTASWRKVLPAFGFDHAKTKYPLLGQHATVSCSSCHVNGDFKKPLRFANCADCHQDVHKGQFSARPAKGECAECHTVDGWKPSLFGVKEHATAKYPLEGRHARVECAQCHLPAGRDTVYQVKFANCADCHKDVHDGQFAKAPYNNRCEACHTVRDFHQPLFTIAQHQKTKFVLSGAHQAVPCSECHKPGLTHRSDKVLPFQFADQTCTACHVDPHRGQFRERMEKPRSDGTPLGCEACHNTASWMQVSGFDHSKTSFPLSGVHRVVACAACHKAVPGSKEVQFKGTAQTCEGCHVDPHGGQFVAKKGGTPCADCHDTQRWAPSLFDHDRRTPFPLQGGHAGVKCGRCHENVREINGKDVLFYKPTPAECAACHKTDPVPVTKRP